MKYIFNGNLKQYKHSHVRNGRTFDPPTGLICFKHTLG